MTPATINALMGAIAAATSHDPLDGAAAAEPGAAARARRVCASSRRRATGSRQELEETNRGVLALYAELDETRAATSARERDQDALPLGSQPRVRTPLNSVRNVARLLLDGVRGPAHRAAPPRDRDDAAVDGYAVGSRERLARSREDRGRADGGSRRRRSPSRTLWGALRGVFRPHRDRRRRVARVRADARRCRCCTPTRRRSRRSCATSSRTRSSSPSAARCACRRARASDGHGRVHGPRHGHRHRPGAPRARLRGVRAGRQPAASAA